MAGALYGAPESAAPEQDARALALAPRSIAIRLDYAENPPVLDDDYENRAPTADSSASC